MLSWKGIEPAVGHAQTPSTLVILEAINGWGFLSSLNEFVMCHQQAENYMRAHGSRIAFFSSFPFVVLEISFKLAVFSIFPLFSTRACLRYDVIAWRAAGGSVLRLITSGSCIWVRTWLWRAFIFTKYPSMAKRAWGKLRALTKGKAS